MTRRVTARLAALLVAAPALTGCATFTDDDIVARVGDAELTEDDLAALAPDGETRIQGELGRNVIALWVFAEGIRADTARLGGDAPPAPTELTEQALNDSLSEAAASWQATEPPDYSASTWRVAYERGPEASEIACTRHILVETKADADSAMSDLESGARFDDLAATLSTDVGSAEQGGALPCLSTVNFRQQLIPEFVQAVFEAEIGEPVGPIESQFGYHIIEVRSFDDIDLTELKALAVEPRVRFSVASTDLDIYVNPRFGTFDGLRGIVPIG